MAWQPPVADVESGGPGQPHERIVAVAPPSPADRHRPVGRPEVPVSWLATAQGGVPNVRGHGGWIRPATSIEDVTRACIASTSARKTPGSVTFAR